MELKRKMVSALAASVLLMSSLVTPVLADTSVEISGNGSNSDNSANITTSTKTLVEQNNTADINNTVNTSANTGGNRASDNTGGDVSIDTGSASSDVNLSTRANVNSADVKDCNCNGNTDVTISGNGTNSDNNVDLKKSSDVQLFQRNNADIRNDVRSNLQTGYNRANDNTGGDVMISTGDARSNVDIQNRANANLASVGGGGSHGSLSARISGNGSNSDNSLDILSDNSVLLEQNNLADIRNRVNVDAETGDNRANDNTGGDVSIDTGDARSMVDVDNRVNFNSADVDCGCLFDVMAKISGNGTDSDNDLDLRLGRDLSVFQGGGERGGNLADLRNDINSDPRSGNNSSNDNTGRVADGVDVMTGDAHSDTTVNNSGNANMFGSNPGLHLGDLDLVFDLGDFLHLLMH